MTSAVTLTSLILTSGYTAANGEVEGEFGAVECTDLRGTTPIFNDNEGAETTAASDALLALQLAVGSQIPLNCPSC